MQNRLARIERELERILPASASADWVDRVSGEKVDNPELSYYRRLTEPGYDLVKRGGKRWRPLMMVLVAEALGGTKSADLAYPLTPVVELPHNGSLIVDDIEDSSDWRRGDLAVHKKFGIDISINAGNLLYYLPTVCIDHSPLSIEKKLFLYQIYAKFLRRVHLGQGLDIVWHREPDLFPERSEYVRMCRYKTGCLAGMSAEMGAAVAQADKQVVMRFGAVAERIGVGFQIRDDVQNLESGNPGKVHGDDIIEGKKSLPIILHVENCPEDAGRISELFNAARKKGIEHAAMEIKEVVNMVTASGAVDEASSISARMLETSMEDLENCLPKDTAPKARHDLIQLVEGFLKR